MKAPEKKDEFQNSGDKSDDGTDDFFKAHPKNFQRKLTCPPEILEEVFHLPLIPNFLPIENNDENSQKFCLDENSNQTNNNATNEKSDANKSHLDEVDIKSKTKHILNKKIVQIPIFVDEKKSRRKSFTMTNPDHRFRTFSEIILVQHHPNYLRNISDFQFIKEIGQGGFGTVWLANDMRTGTQCAIKELHKTELKGHILTSFLREIHTMIIAQNRFICPIVGYTIEPPYSIITKYMPGGNLFHVVRNINKESQKVKPKVYGTHLTIICMCIAYAMNKCHQRGILHRDLKAGNVLLDNKGMPVIIDFGVSRQMDESNRHSQKVGTVSHMAPEVITSDHYDGKADVFSYGILLYEVGEMKHAWKNANKREIEVQNNIVRGNRPQFTPELLPLPMKQLIVRCWSGNPATRPTFDKIFEIFMEGKTFFKGSDPKKIIKFGQKLLDDESKGIENIIQPLKTVDTEAVIKRLTRKLTRKGPLRKTLVKQQNIKNGKIADAFVDKIIQKPIVKELSSDVMEVVDIPMPIFRNDDKEISTDPTNPLFMSYVEYQSTRITPSQFPNLARVIIPVLTRTTLTNSTSNNVNTFQNPENITKNSASLDYDSQIREILKLLLAMTNRNVKFIEKVQEFHILPSIQLNNEYEEEFFLLLSQFFIHTPNLLNQTHTRIIAYFINKRPNDVICLFSRYVAQIDVIDDPFPLLDFLLSYARVYLNIPAGSNFIDLFFFLTKEYQEYRKQRFNDVKPIFTAFIRSESVETACTAMKAVCSLYDSSFKLNIKVLVSYLMNKRTALYALSLIERLPEYPSSMIFVQNIESLCWKSKRATRTLLKFAGQSFDCAKLLTIRTSWMLCRGENILKIFLEIFTQQPSLRESLANAREFPQFLLYQAFTHEKSIIESLALVIKRLPNLNSDLIEKLENVGFFREIISHAEISSPLGVMMIIESSSKHHFVPSFEAFVHVLISFLPLQNELTSAAIYSLTVLSFKKELKHILNMPTLIEYFNALLQIDSQKKLANAFLKNVLS
ncbi:TKL family protein kinase [Tritrichomonas foetus]|uniref:TKL family protein kinase n=1 Tax=Tritrichomonas foetus TaxID=1144522 RepID=A0A1J4K032_9EUKA|nr:TKL family protein kinase [Tritrichomonas foetus]|eukprot:OHT04088.1 TKL family protein kinase [Tritrichomonas foetus]